MGYIRIAWVFLHVFDGSVFLFCPILCRLPGLRGQKMGPEPSESALTSRGQATSEQAGNLQLVAHLFQAGRPAPSR